MNGEGGAAPAAATGGVTGGAGAPMGGQSIGVTNVHEGMEKAATFSAPTATITPMQASPSQIGEAVEADAVSNGVDQALTDIASGDVFAKTSGSPTNDSVTDEAISEDITQKEHIEPLQEQFRQLEQKFHFLASQNADLKLENKASKEEIAKVTEQATELAKVVRDLTEIILQKTDKPEEKESLLALLLQIMLLFPAIAVKQFTEAVVPSELAKAA